jgi:hypothetical protein
MAKATHPGEHEDAAFTGAGHGGRAKSWLAVTVILLGFVVGGLALIFGPNWFMFWVGAGIIVLGGILALAFDIFSDVIVDARRTMPPQESHIPFALRPRSK